MSATRSYTVDLGELLGSTFSVWFKNIVPFTLLSLLLFAPVLVATYLVAHVEASATPEEFGLTKLTSAVFILVLETFCQMLLTGTLTFSVLASLRGESLPIGACIRKGLSNVVPVFLVSLLSGVFIFLGVLLLLIPGIYAMLALYLVVPVTLMESPGIENTLRRSKELMYGSKLIVLLAIIIFIVIGAVAGGITAGIYAGISGGSFGSDEGDPIYQVMEATIGIPFAPLGAIVPALVYFMIRRKKEGQQYEDLAKVFD